MAPKNALIIAGGMNAAIEAHDLPLAGEWLGRSTPEMAHEPILLREEERYLSFKGDYRQSAQIGQQALKAMPHDRDVVVYLGYDLLSLGKWDELQALTQQYETFFQKNPIFHFC